MWERAIVIVLQNIAVNTSNNIEKETLMTVNYASIEKFGMVYAALSDLHPPLIAFSVFVCTSQNSFWQTENLSDIMRTTC